MVPPSKHSSSACSISWPGSGSYFFPFGATSIGLGWVGRVKELL